MSTPPDHDPYAALRHRDFLLYLVASMCGTVGVEMQTVAVQWELYERTSSALGLGLIGLVQIIPFLAIVFPAGHLADRISRRRIIIAAQGVQALVAVGLALVAAKGASVTWIYGLLALSGAANAFSYTSRAAFVPQLVPLMILPNAITWRTSGWQLANIAGPAFAGVAFYFGLRAPAIYRIHVVLGVVVIALLARMAPRPRPRSVEPLSWRALTAGVGFVRGRPLILSTMTLDLFAVLLGGATSLLPIFARDILHVGASGLGTLRAAPAVGAMVMAIALAHRPPLRRAGRALIIVVIGFGAATVVFGLSRSFGLSLAMLALTGAFDMVSVVIRTTLVQTLTPDPMRGRVAAVNAVFVSMSNELGSFESGVTAWLMGPIGSVLLGGFGSLIVVALVALRWPALAHLGSLGDLARKVAESEPRSDMPVSTTKRSP